MERSDSFSSFGGDYYPVIVPKIKRNDARDWLIENMNPDDFVVFYRVSRQGYQINFKTKDEAMMFALGVGLIIS